MIDDNDSRQQTAKWTNTIQTPRKKFGIMQRQASAQDKFQTIVIKVIIIIIMIWLLSRNCLFLRKMCLLELLPGFPGGFSRCLTSSGELRHYQLRRLFLILIPIRTSSVGTQLFFSCRSGQQEFVSILWCSIIVIIVGSWIVFFPVIRTIT